MNALCAGWKRWKKVWKKKLFKCDIDAEDLDYSNTIAWQWRMKKLP